MILIGQVMNLTLIILDCTLSSFDYLLLILYVYQWVLPLNITSFGRKIAFTITGGWLLITLPLIFGMRPVGKLQESRKKQEKIWEQRKKKKGYDENENDPIQLQEVELGPKKEYGPSGNPAAPVFAASMVKKPE